VGYEDTEKREPDDDPWGTCDWGYCDSVATAWRWSWQHGWLPVCGDCLTKPRPESELREGDD